MRRNYQVSSSCIDLEARIDDTLSLSENFSLLKDEILLLCPKPNKITFS